MTIYSGKSVADLINASSSDDYINGHAGADTLNGGAGHDEIWGGTEDNANDIIKGGDGNDTIGGEGGNDSLYGDAGNDVVYGGDGKDYVEGGLGNDTIWGQAGNDSIVAEDGNDSIYGGDGSDTMRGGNGRDYLQGDTNNQATVNKITVAGHYANGDKVSVSDQVKFEVDGNHIGFQGSNVKGGRFGGEVDYMQGVGSERISVDFGAPNVNEVTFDVKLFFAGRPEDAFPEILKWQAFDDCGCLVDSGTFTGTCDGTRTMTVKTDCTFQKIVFSAADNGDRCGDNSDFALRWLEFKTVKDGSGNDWLDAGANNDTLQGGLGDDNLAGRTDDGTATISGKSVTNLKFGDDITGGAGADTFIYYKNDGVDQINDFQNGVDHIRLMDVANFAALSGKIFEQNGDTFIAFSNNNVMVLEGVHATAIDASDFIFG